MTVVVKNERGTPWVFDGSSGKRRVEPGEVQVISDEEWGSIISAHRGAGKMRALWPSEATSDISALELDYYVVGSSYEIRYLGMAQQGSPSSDPVWIVKRFDHTVLGGDNLISEIQVIEGVAWDDRATLSWA